MKKLLLPLLVCSVALSAGAALQSGSTSQPSVKKSTSGVCHAADSRFYERIKHFTAYNSLKACLDSGGKMSSKATNK